MSDAVYTVFVLACLWARANGCAMERSARKACSSLRLAYDGYYRAKKTSLASKYDKLLIGIIPYSQLRYVSLMYTNPSFSFLPLLSSVEKLVLSHTPFTDLSILRGLKSLTEIDLCGTRVSDLSHLKEMTQLKGLTLSYMDNITDISPVSTLVNLNSLSFPGVHTSDLSILSGLTKLTWLNFERLDVQDVSVLTNLNALRVLYMSHTCIGDVSIVQHLPRLSILAIKDTRVCDLSPLSTLSELRTLYISGTQVRDLSPLAHCTKLELVFLHTMPHASILEPPANPKTKWIGLND